MAKNKVRYRHNKILDFSPYSTVRSNNKRIFNDGGYKIPVVSNGLTAPVNSGLAGNPSISSGPTAAQKLALFKGKLGSVASMAGSVFGAATSAASGIGTMVNTFKEQSAIKDTAQEQSEIDNLEAAEYGAGDTNSLLSQWNDTDFLDADYTMDDILGMSKEEATSKGIASTLDSTVSMASAGASIGSIIPGLGTVVGGVVGGLAGLFGGIGSAIGGRQKAKRKAQAEADRLNQEIEDANTTAHNNFNIAVDDQAENMARQREYALYGADGGELNFKLGEGFLYDGFKDNIDTASISNNGYPKRQYNTGKYKEGYNPGNTPVSGFFEDETYRSMADKAWTAAELLPVVGNIMGIADVTNDIRNISNSKYIDSGDIGNLLLDTAGLIPGVSTIKKGAKAAKLLKLNKVYNKLDKLGEHMEYASPEGIKNLKEELQYIKKYNKEAKDKALKAATSKTKEEIFKNAATSKNASDINETLLESFDKALNPNLLKYNILQKAGSITDFSNDAFNFVGNVEEEIKKPKNDTAFTERKYDTGGFMNSHGANWTNGLIKIDEGGTHEESPYEGVPMGVAPDNKPNLVEEGEVIYNDYVFSNRLSLDKKELKKNYLPKKYHNYTFAKAAEDMSKESEERPNDPISRRGMENSLMKLAMIQERQRAEKGLTGTQKMMACGGRKYSGEEYITHLGDPYSKITADKKKMPAIIDKNAYRDFINMLNAPEAPALSTDIEVPIAKAEAYDPMIIWDNNINVPDIIPVYNEDFSNIKDAKLDVPFLTYDPYIGSKEQKKEEREFNKAASKNKDIQSRTNSLLRYAPALGSAINSIRLAAEEPDYTNADMIYNAATNLSNDKVQARLLNDYLTYKPLDRNFYLNKLYNQAAATRAAIQNSGANAGAAMSGLLAADYNTKNAVADAIMKMDMYNQQQRQNAAQFNRGTRQYNSQALMNADAQNAQIAANRDRMRLAGITTAAQMREGADTALAQTRSASYTNFWNNLGNIGIDDMNQSWRNRLLEAGAYGPGAERVAKCGGMLTKKNRRRK